MSWYILLMLLFPSWMLAENYCRICHDHTMCKYQSDSSETCGTDKQSGVSASEIQEILSIHNNIRSNVALGKERRGLRRSQPQAANMQALVWDTNLAAVAQKWADQCIFQHDSCRDDSRFQVGQNIYFSSGLPNAFWTRAVTAWYDEVQKFDPRTVDSFNFQSTIGHYTQLVWANTRYIGCGKVAYNSFRTLKNYRPIEYILSPIPRNISAENTADEDKRRTDIISESEDPVTMIENSDESQEVEMTQSSTIDYENENKEEITTERADKPEEATTTEEITSIEKPEGALESPASNTSSRTPTFSIYIPGYWISRSQPSANGKILGTFQSLEFANIADLNHFIQATPPNGVAEVASWNPLSGQWSIKDSTTPSNSGTDDLSKIQTDSLTEKIVRNHILVCNYGPAGNYLHQPVYIKGRACSQCPSGFTCSNGLCV